MSKPAIHVATAAKSSHGVGDARPAVVPAHDDAPVGLHQYRIAKCLAARRDGLPAVEAGIAAAVPGNHIEDVSGAVEDVAVEGECGIVRPYVGHGIGTRMHEDLQIPNYRTGNRGIELVPGVCMAIEPMLTLGSADVETLGDGWTVVTADHSLAAHFEHTIAVTDNGPEILTTV